MVDIIYMPHQTMPDSLVEKIHEGLKATGKSYSVLDQWHDLPRDGELPQLLILDQGALEGSNYLLSDDPSFSHLYNTPVIVVSNRKVIQQVQIHAPRLNIIGILPIQAQWIPDNLVRVSKAMDSLGAEGRPMTSEHFSYTLLEEGGLIPNASEYHALQDRRRTAEV